MSIVLFTWDVFGELYQNLDLAGRHFRQQQEILLCTEVLLQLWRHKGAKETLGWMFCEVKA